jgi:hypothetical protein
MSTAMSDHTIDAVGQTGNYLLVNPGAGPREFYHRAVSNLCPGTTYTLTFYAGNITRESGTPGVCLYNNLPSLQVYTFPAGTAIQAEASQSTGTFSGAGGTLLGSTGAIGCPSQTTFTWNEYSYNFTTGAAETSIDLVFVSLFGNNAGYDFAFDDITFTCGTPLGILNSNTSQEDYFKLINTSDNELEILFKEGVKANVSLVDLLGNEIYNTVKTQEDISIKISKANLPAGVYIIRIFMDNKVYSKKIMVN